MSSPLLSRLRLAARLARAEGLRSLGERLADERADRRRFEGWEEVPASAWRADPTPVDRLYVLPFPLARSRGGVAHHLALEIEREAGRISIALLERRAERFQLSLWPGAGQPARWSSWPAESGEGEEVAWTSALGLALRMAPPRKLRVENVAGLPLGALDGVGLPLELAAHDYALHCPRAHPVEAPVGAYCGLPDDPERCARCLASDRFPAGSGGMDAEAIRAHRTRAAALLDRAELRLFPSEATRSLHARLFPASDLSQAVVQPPLRYPSRPSRPSRTPETPPRRVAFVGAVHRHKGTGIFEEVVRRVRSAAPELGISWHVLGGGDPLLLDRLRALGGVRVHGYYRAGTLPARLVEARIDLALLLSPWPETYCLALDECVEGGVPVIAFDLGAVAERLASGGDLVPPEEGAAGVAERILARARAAP